MAKLYFKYGAMGSSKSAQALTTKFNYEEKGMTVWLIKPGTDTRDGADIIRSRIGLQQQAQVIHPDEDIIAAYHAAGDYDVIIADEAQFLTPEQIDKSFLLEIERRVSADCVISIDQIEYEVDCRFAKQKITLRYTPEMDAIYVVETDGSLTPVRLLNKQENAVIKREKVRLCKEED